MFCYQCEQTSGGTGCTKVGVCGKDSQTAQLQDLLLYAARGISMYAHRLRNLGIINRQIDMFVIEALFSTVTNVNFDPDRLQNLLHQAGEMISRAASLYEDACRKNNQTPEVLDGPAAWRPAGQRQSLLDQAAPVGIEKRRENYGEEIAGLQELLTCGLKGAAAYADHAAILGRVDNELLAFFPEALNFLTTDKARDPGELVNMAFKCGQVNLKIMELLDAAHTGTYGHPEPTQVRVTPLKGKCIAVSGHDLKDLDELLKQTEGRQINVYTHGEMLPALAYPQLKKYPHLVGNYGGAWQNQKKEFDDFPGAILMTTNCIQKPRDTYQTRIFTTGLVASPGVAHLPDKNFTPVIEAALAAPGFTEDAEEKKITIGFAHHTVISLADKIVQQVKARKIKHFFLIGGCDGAKPGRDYYTEFARSVPDDCVILTLACGKYRFNKLDFGSIDGIPRLLDIGQCNDAYSAVLIAVALAEAFGCAINDLPLSMVLSWYEQKAVAILLTLLHLGIKNIKLGPSLPAFVSPGVLKVLVEKFNIAPIGNVPEDMAQLLKSHQN